MSTQLSIPCLGRPFNLGMLYDCRTEELIPSITLLDANKIQSVLQIKEQPSSSYEIITDDSIATKASSLGIDANLNLSLMCGLVKVDGAAKYLSDKRSSKKQSRVTLQYMSTTRFEQLTIDKISDIQFPDMLDATHVVTGITYGADAFFVFDCLVSEGEKFSDVSGNMQAAIESIPLLTGSVSVGGTSVDYKGTDKVFTDKFHCKFYSDVIVSSNPSTFDEALRLYQDLPKLLKGETRSVPKLVYLSPLSTLDCGKPRQIIQSISFDLIAQVEEIMEKFHDTEMCICDLLKHDICSKFVDINSQLSKLKTLLSRFKVKFMENLSQTLPKIRSTGADESKFAGFISSIHRSPFSFDELQTYLKGKEKEIKQLAQHLKNMMKEAKVKFDFPDNCERSCDLTTLTVDDELEYVACFGFNVTSPTSRYLQNLEAYLQNGKSKSVVDDEWVDKPAVAKQLRAKSKMFLDFAKTNSSEKDIAFVVSSSNKDTGACDPCIVMYRNGVAESFDLLSAPGTPQATEITTDSIRLSWTAPKNATPYIQYKVLYRRQNEAFKDITISAAQCVLDKLCPGTVYEFQVLPNSRFAVKSGMASFKTKSIARPANDFLPLSICVEPNKNPCCYKLPLTLVHANKKDGLNKYDITLQQTSLKQRNVKSLLPFRLRKPEKVLMVLGATGVGKSTLINGMANYLLGVRWEDNFRFQVVADVPTRSQAHSQTRDITAYSFGNTCLPFNLTIVDTPGFGDTGGIERDKYIAQQIRQFFSGKDQCSIDQLHGVGFVTQASLPRLTATQKFIFNAILSIFGRDISDNIFLMTTFADASDPPVLEAVNLAQIPYKEFFKFNNSALFADNQVCKQLMFNSMFWEMGYESFKQFFDAFSKADTKSLALTREVLKERHQLETLIPGLQEQVDIGMFQMGAIQKEEGILRQHEAEINANKDFTYEIEVTKFKRVPLESGIHTTTCLKCNFTCHKDCHISEDKWKSSCCAMDDSGNCQICPEKCIWSSHSNIPFIHEYYTEKETLEFEDLKKKYSTAKSQKESAEAMLAENEEKLINMQVEVYILIEQAQKSIERLDQIALKPNPLNTELEYLDLLIESEKQEASPGWEGRVKQYMEFRKDAELYKKIGENSVELIQLDDRPELKKKFKMYLKIRKEAEQNKMSTQSWWRQAGNYIKSKFVT